jgi:hypothetical protein
MPKPRKKKSASPPSRVTFTAMRSLVAPPAAPTVYLAEDHEARDRFKAAWAAAHPPEPIQHSSAYYEKLERELAESSKAE